MLSTKPSLQEYTSSYGVRSPGPQIFMDITAGQSLVSQQDEAITTKNSQHI